MRKRNWNDAPVQFQAMFEAVSWREFDILLFWALDRLKGVLRLSSPCSAIEGRKLLILR